MLKKLNRKLKKDIHLKDLINGSVITFFLKIFGMGLSFIMISLISKKFGAEGVGFYSVLFNLLTVSGIVLSLGFNLSVIRYVGHYNKNEDRYVLVMIHRYYTKLIGILSLLFGSILFFGSDRIQKFFELSDDFNFGLKIIGVAIPFYTVNLIGVEFIRGLKKVSISEFIRSVFKPLIFIIVFFIFWGILNSVIDVIYIFLLSVILSSILSGIVIFLETRLINFSPVQFSEREFLKTSLNMSVGTISTTIFSSLPIFILQFFENISQVGIYSVSFRIASLVSIILTVINTIAGPKIAELYWAKEFLKLRRMINQSVTITFWIAFAMGITLTVFDTYFLGLFGEEFLEGNHTLFVLVLAQLINAWSGPSGIFLNMTDNHVVMRRISLYTTIFTTFLMVLFIYKFGIIGAAFSVLIKSIINNGFAIFYSKKYVNFTTYYNPFVKY